MRQPCDSGSPAARNRVSSLDRSSSACCPSCCSASNRTTAFWTCAPRPAPRRCRPLTACARRLTGQRDSASPTNLMPGAPTCWRTGAVGRWGRGGPRWPFAATTRPGSPTSRRPCGGGGGTAVATRVRPYDRIVCDVPCSGDGTLRKDVKVWRTWHPGYGIALHPLQVRIAKRGIALLRVGGIMTYSTCSFHPVENEAVVAALLATGTVEIVPVRDSALRDVPSRPGLSHWRVLNDDCEEVERRDAGHGPSLWPPDPSTATAAQLRHCVRMVPHGGNTGGFFIAVLRKIREFPVSTQRRTSIAAKQPTVTPTAPQHQLHSVTNSDESAADFRYVSRSPSNKRLFRLTPSLAKHLLESAGSAKLHVVYAGQATSTRGK
jgi:hypothetical protein